MSSPRTANFPRSGSPVSDRQSRSGSWKSGRSKKRRSRSPDSAGTRNSGNTLYINNLPTWVTQNDVCELFSTLGKVIDCRLVRNTRNNKSRGFAFISMETKDVASRCIKHLDHTFYFDRVITVERAKSNLWSPPPPNNRDTRYKREERGRRTRRQSPRRRRDRDRYSRDQSRSPKRRQDRYRYSRDRSHSQTPKQWKDRYGYSRDRRRRSPSPKTHRRRRD